METNEAQDYGVKIGPIDGVEYPGQPYWRVKSVRHLPPEENRGRHNVYVTALDANGQRVHDPNLRVGYTWEGRRDPEDVKYPALDKPDNEPASNIPIERGMVMAVWLEEYGRASEAVEYLHTAHPDEPGPNGELWNTAGHHSFEVVFERAFAGEQPVAPPAPPVPTAPPTENGAGVVTAPVAFSGPVTIRLEVIMPDGSRQYGQVTGDWTPTAKG